jgi:hypothetical protein
MPKRGSTSSLLRTERWPEDCSRRKNRNFRSMIDELLKDTLRSKECQATEICQSILGCQITFDQGRASIQLFTEWTTREQQSLEESLADMEHHHI